MGDVKIKHKRIKINTKTTELLSTVTGEITQVKNATLYKSIPTNEATINYKTYIYLDTDKLTILLSQGLKQVDLALLTTLSGNLQHRYCVCLKNTERPHTTNSIAELIGETPQGVKIKLNRLIKLNLLAYTKSIGNTSWGKVYIMNPHFIKKGLNFSKSVCELFDDIKKTEKFISPKDAFSTS